MLMDGNAWNQIIALIIILSACITFAGFALMLLCVGLYKGLRALFRVDTTVWE